MTDNVIKVDFRTPKSTAQIRTDAQDFIREVRSRVGGFNLHDTAGVQAIVEASEAIIRAVNSQPAISASFTAMVTPEAAAEINRQLNDAAGNIARHWAEAMARATQAAVYRTLFDIAPSADT
jgi:hypothetical protein